MMLPGHGKAGSARSVTGGCISVRSVVVRLHRLLSATIPGWGVTHRSAPDMGLQHS